MIYAQDDHTYDDLSDREKCRFIYDYSPEVIEDLIIAVQEMPDDDVKTLLYVLLEEAKDNGVIADKLHVLLDMVRNPVAKAYDQMQKGRLQSDNDL